MHHDKQHHGANDIFVADGGQYFLSHVDVTEQPAPCEMNAEISYSFDQKVFKLSKPSSIGLKNMVIMDASCKQYHVFSEFGEVRIFFC